MHTALHGNSISIWKSDQHNNMNEKRIKEKSLFRQKIILRLFTYSRVQRAGERTSIPRIEENIGAIFLHDYMQYSSRAADIVCLE